MSQSDSREVGKAVADQARNKVSKSAEHLEATAGAVKQSTRELTDSAQLAADRTVLAGERTYAAWVRTGLAA